MTINVKAQMSHFRLYMLYPSEKHVINNVKSMSVIDILHLKTESDVESRRQEMLIKERQISLEERKIALQEKQFELEKKEWEHVLNLNMFGN